MPSLCVIYFNEFFKYWMKIQSDQTCVKKCSLISYCSVLHHVVSAVDCKLCFSTAKLRIIFLWRNFFVLLLTVPRPLILLHCTRSLKPRWWWWWWWWYNIGVVIIIIVIIQNYNNTKQYKTYFTGEIISMVYFNTILNTTIHIIGARGSAVSWGTVLQVGRSRVRFPMVSVEFFIDIILPAALRPWSRLSL